MEVGTIEDVIKYSDIAVAVKFPEADAMIAEAIDPVGVNVTFPAAIAELKEFKALEMAEVGTMVLLAKADWIEANWADIDSMFADIERNSEGIEVAVIKLEVTVTELEVEVEAEDSMALERLAAIDEELILKFELILKRFEETLARAAESEVGLIEAVNNELIFCICEAKVGLVAVAM